jgi:hypothetical protein
MTYILLKFLKPSKDTLSDETSITMQKPIAIKLSYPVYSSLRTIVLTKIWTKTFKRTGLFASKYHLKML